MPFATSTSGPIREFEADALQLHHFGTNICSDCRKSTPQQSTDKTQSSPANESTTPITERDQIKMFLISRNKKSLANSPNECFRLKSYHFDCGD